MCDSHVILCRVSTNTGKLVRIVADYTVAVLYRPFNISQPELVQTVASDMTIHLAAKALEQLG
jgi:hypothetical protein